MNFNANNEYKTFQAFPTLGASQANVYVFKAQTSKFHEVQVPLFSIIK